ncbi:hypothetical protein LZ31DRAFT_593837 [Colletotrichum somersetense]|nr:hypothetical protein LZ31DRAFT_593837 [Colletotrichum somersetense]
MDTFSNYSKASSGNETPSLVTYRMPTTRSDRRPSITMSLSTDRLRSTSRQRVGTSPGTRHRTPLSVPAVALVGLSLLSAPTAAQQDPVADFCRRFGNQTAVVDNRLFIDGDLVNWNPLSFFPANYTNTWLSYQDLSTTSATRMPPLYANLFKNGSIPNVAGGALWSHSVNKRLYLFGGEHNLCEPQLPFNLYNYDILSNQWDFFGPSRTGATISKLSNNFVWGTGPTVATTGLVKYTMDINSFANNTGPDGIRCAGDSLQYIPADDSGMLIYFGVTQDLSTNGTARGQPMDQIFIYDVLSSKWDTQKASGEVPEMRRRYMYGGATAPGVLGGGYDDLYVLSIPTFTWVKMHPAGRNGTGDYPHHSLSCNMIPGRGQMIITGGQFPTTPVCDSPGQWDTHNVDLGKQNPGKSVWDLYRPNKTAYAVPDEVLAVVGGNGGGGATKTAPANGFDYADVGLLITIKADVVVYDAHGNMWVPQVSMVQVATGASPPLPGYTRPMGDQKTTPPPAEAEVQPSPAHEPQELSAEPGDRAEKGARHQTYYNP